MKYYLEKSNDDLYSVVVRGNDAKGKPYRLFVKIDGQVVKVDPKNWIKKGDKDFDRNKFVRKNPILNTFLRDLKNTLEERVTANKIQNPLYSFPDAWLEVYPPIKVLKDELSDIVFEAIDPFLRDSAGNKSKGYLRHFKQLKTDLQLWNPSLQFDNLNETNLKSYLTYLKAEGETQRNPLRSSTINHHFKHLRQIARYASRRKKDVDATVFDFKPGKVIYELGCFELFFEELMVLWHYKAENKIEEVVLNHSLFEAFTGVRTGDLYSFKDDGTVHGIKCGDVSKDTITYRDRKNFNIIKTVTRHKFNSKIIDKYLDPSDPNRLLMPALIQQTSNRIIKEIARKAGLARSIRRGGEIKPIHEAISSHCFRSSYGNLLYRIGVPTEMISEELGHAATSVTIKHYLKFSERHKVIREKMNNLVIALPSKDAEK